MFLRPGRGGRQAGSGAGSRGFFELSHRKYVRRTNTSRIWFGKVVAISLFYHQGSRDQEPDPPKTCLLGTAAGE